MNGEDKISVLMPTYNDAKYISTAIASLLNQSYKNLELIVVDGSTDETPKIVKELAAEDIRIEYLREQQSGQLNALAQGTQFINGKYVTLLHSDDGLLDKNAFKRNVSMLQQVGYDGVFSDLLLMDGQGEIQGTINLTKEINHSSPAMLFLRGGINLVPDFFFVRREAFENVLSSYITWNMPYWLRFDKTEVGTLSLKKINPWYKYRVYPENYVQSDVGRFEMSNGCIRTVLEIGKRRCFPFLTAQRLIARVLKTRTKPYFKLAPSQPKDLQDMVTYVVNSYFKKIPHNSYFNGLMGFYSNFPSTRIIKLHFDEEAGLLGKDARVFYNLMGQKLPAIYEYILDEAASGFGSVSVRQEDSQKARNLLRFLNLIAKVKVEQD
jgi:glycosyltransferase involved in cell wall biosynthesis